MLRATAIELLRRQIYGGQPSDDAEITIGLVNQWLEPAIAVAAKTNYNDSIKLDGIAYVNGGFYTTFKGLEVDVDEAFLYKVALPQIPVGLGNDEGISTIQLKDPDSRQITQPFIWVTQAQKAYYKNMRPIPNKILCYLEGGYVYIISTIVLNSYTATVCMISGGDMDDLQSELNIPMDYFPIMADYIKQQLGFEKAMSQDSTNDGVDTSSVAQIR
jgi:hypothetical protein